MALRSHVPAAVGLTVVAGIYAWPLLAVLTTAIPGVPRDHDVATMVWNQWHIHRALTGEAPLFRVDDVIVPFGADLRLHTYGLFQGLLGALFVGWIGVIGAFNLVVVGTLMLNGVCGYALIVREVGDRIAAFVAATWLMLSSPVLAQLRVGRPSFGSIWIVMVALILFDSLLARPRPWKGVALGLTLLAGLSSDFQVFLFAVLWLVLWGAARLWQDGWRRLGAAHVLALTLGVAVCGVPFLAAYYPALAQAASLGYASPSWRDMSVYSFRVWDYVTPRYIQQIWGYEFLAASVAALVVIGSRGSRGRVGAWLIGAGALLVLALGPILQPTELPLPYAALGLWPPMAQFRTPSRLVIPAVIGFAVVAGYVLAGRRPRAGQWTAQLTWLLVGAAVVGRLGLAVIHDPLAVQHYPVYDVYTRIAGEPGRFALLEVPFGVRSGLERVGSGGEVLQYYQVTHGKPLLNGMIARLPTTVFEFYRRHPSLVFLSGEPTTADEIELTRDFREVLAWSGARYVLVHHDRLPDGSRIGAFLDRFEGLAQQATERDLVVYEVVSGSRVGG